VFPPFSFDFTRVSESLVQHQVLLQKQMPEVSPLISEMEEELACWWGHIAKVAEAVTLEEAVSLVQEEMHWVEAEAAAAAKHKAEVGKQQGTSKSVPLELSDDDESSMVSKMCFLLLLFFFFLKNIADAGICVVWRMHIVACMGGGWWQGGAQAQVWAWSQPLLQGVCL
jgi:hypothetical protein